LIRGLILGVLIGLFSALLLFIVIGYFRIILYYELDLTSLVRFVFIGTP